MRRAFLVAAFLTVGLIPSIGGIRAPSCVALVAFAFGSRSDPIEVAFGKTAAAMTLDEFDQALDIVAACLALRSDRSGVRKDCCSDDPR
jgi:hypothetical protein